MINLVRLARVLLILALAFIVLSLLRGLVSPDTGVVEKVALVLLMAACVYGAGRVTDLSDRARRRLAQR